jgi:hypothetical protein
VAGAIRRRLATAAWDIPARVRARAATCENASTPAPYGRGTCRAIHGRTLGKTPTIPSPTGTHAR